MTLLQVVARNWPTAGMVHEIKGLSLEAQVSDSERRRLRNAGITSVVEIDGKLLAPAGQSTAGTPIRITLVVRQVLHTLRWLDDMFKSNPAWLDDILQEAGIDSLPQDNWQPLVRGDVFGFVEQTRQIFYPVGSLIL